jgi:diguanylate cyclase (GGDEF)-like protein
LKSRLLLRLGVSLLLLWQACYALGSGGLDLGQHNIEWSVEELNLPLEQIQKLEQNLSSLVVLPHSAWSAYETNKHLQQSSLSKWLRIELHNVSDHSLLRLLEFEHTLNPPEHLFIGLNEDQNVTLVPITEVKAVLPATIFVAIQMEPQAYTYVFIKVELSQFVPIEVMLWEQQKALEHVQMIANIEGSQMGTMVALTCFSLFMLVVLRSLSYFYYSLLALLCILLYSTFHGHTPYKVWDVPFTILLLPICIGITAVFTTHSFDLKTKNRALHWLCLTVLGGMVLLFFGYFGLHRLVEAQTIISLALVPILLLLSVGLIRYKQGESMALLFLLGWFSLLIGIVLALFMYVYNGFTVQGMYNILIASNILQMLWWKAFLIERLQTYRIQQEKEQQNLLEQQKRVQLTQEIALKAEEHANIKLEHLILERTQKLELTMKELNDANIKLSKQATIDSLTGIKNKKAFEEYVLSEALQSKREGQSLSLLMVDLDKFKTINDNLGHLAGDHVLKSVADAMQNCLKRPKDMVARFGGEEFSVCLPNTREDGALFVAERIRKTLEALEIFWDSRRILVTASLGVSTTVIEKNEDVYRLIETADKGLYEAKSLGRNQVCFMPYQ